MKIVYLNAAYFMTTKHVSKRRYGVKLLTKREAERVHNGKKGTVYAMKSPWIQTGSIIHPLPSWVPGWRAEETTKTVANYFRCWKALLEVKDE